MNTSCILRLDAVEDSVAPLSLSHISFLRKRAHSEALSCSEMGDFIMCINASK